MYLNSFRNPRQVSFLTLVHNRCKAEHSPRPLTEWLTGMRTAAVSFRLLCLLMNVSILLHKNWNSEEGFPNRKCVVPRLDSLNILQWNPKSSHRDSVGLPSYVHANTSAVYPLLAAVQRVSQCVLCLCFTVCSVYMQTLNKHDWMLTLLCCR